MRLRIRFGIRAVIALVMVAVSADAFGLTATFTGQDDAINWNNPFNWDTGVVPNGNDDVIINNTGSIVRVQETSAAKTLVLLSGAKLQINAGQHLTVGGSTTVPAGSGWLHLLGGSTFTTNGTMGVDGTVDIQDGTIDGSGWVDVNNNGEVTSSGNSTIACTIINHAGGTIEVTAGTLTLNGGSSQGSLTTTSPSILAFSSRTYAVIGGTIGGTGTLSFTGATAIVGIPIDDIGSLNVTAGTVTLNGNASAGAFAMSGGTLNGSGALTLTNGGTWSGGTMAGSGTTSNPATKTLNITAPVTLNRTLQNNGTLSAGGNITGSGSITGTGTLSFAAGSVTIAVAANVGSLSVTAGTATLNAAVSTGAFAMSGGTLNGSGALTLTNGGTWSGGTMAGSGTTINPATKTLSITAPATLNRTLQNNGTLSAGGNITGSGSITGTGTLSFAAGSVTIAVAASVGSLSVTAGTATLNAAVSTGAFTMSGGTLNGNGTLTLTNGGTWSGGTMAGSGTTINPATKTLSITAAVTLSRSLQNDGTLSITSPAIVAFTSGTFSVTGAGTISGTGALSFTGATATVGIPINNIGSLSVTAGTATLNGNVSAGAFVLSGGTLNGSGALTLTNGGTWSGGTMAGSGTTSNPAAKTLSITAPVTLNRSFQDDGTLNITSPGSIAFASGTLSIAGGGTISGTGALSFTGATATVGIPINNIGSLSVTAGTVTLNGNASAGAFILSGGTLNGSGALTLTNGGTWSGGTMAGSGTTTNPAAKTLNITAAVNASRSLQNDGTLSVMSPGSIAFASGTHSITGAGTISGTGTLSFTGAAATVGNLVNNIGSLSVTAGTVTLNGNASAGAFAMSGGTLNGSGALTLTNGGTWSGGTMAGSGTTTNPAAKTLSITAPVALNRTLQNNGTLSAGGDITGTGSITGTGTLSFATGSATIGVAATVGSLSVTAGVATLNGTTSAGAFAMSGGTLNGSGTLTLTNGGTWSGGTMAGSGTTSNPAAKTLSITAAVPLNRPLQNDGTLSITSPGSLVMSSGTVAITGGGTVSGTGMLSFTGATATVGNTIDNIGTLSVTAGTATLNAGASAGVLTMNGGTLDGSGTLTLTQGGTWSGGTMSGTGLTANPAMKTLSITAPITLNRTLQNNGTLDVSGNVSGSGTIANDGMLDAVGNVTLATVVNNSGQVAAIGTLSLAGGGTHTGSFNAPAPGILEFSSGTHSMSGSGSISGTGTLSFTGATATVGLPVNVGTLNLNAGSATLNAASAADGFSMNDGILGGSGTLTLNNGGSWSGGTMSGSGSTVNPATKTLSIASPVTLNSRTLQNDGTLDLSGNVAGSGTIANNGTLNVLASSIISAVLNNSGQIATSSALSLTGGGTHTGTFNVTTPGNLAFSSGTHTFSSGMSGGSIGGTGTLSFDGATATVGVPISVGALSVSAGTATLNASAAADGFTMSGGTVGGSGTLTLNNGGSWSGGTMSGSGATINPATKTLSIASPVTLNSRTLQNDGTLDLSGNVAGSGTIANNGTLNVLASSIISAVLNNSGQIATSSALSLTGGGTHTGTFNITIPGSLALSSGTHTFSSGMSAGSIGGTGTLSFDGATATVGVPISVGALSVSAGTATLNASAAADGFLMNGGTIGGSGTLTLNNGGTWSSGTMSGSGMTVNPATKTLSILSPVTLSSRTLQNGGTLDVSGDVAGSGTIANNGTLNILGGSIISAVLNNSGQVATSSALSLTGGGTHTGTFNVTTPGNLAFTSGTHTFSGGSIAGTGTLSFDGATATLAVPVNVGALSVSAGTATLNASTAADAFTMNGGTLGGSGTLTLNNGGTWAGGTMSGGGMTVNPATKTLSIPSPVALSSRTLQNNGTLNVSGAVVTGSGSIDNNGTINDTTGATISAPMNNQGQVTTSAVLSLAGSGSHGGTFTASGPASSIDFSGGTQTISGTLSGTGKYRFSGAAATVNGAWSGNRIDVTGGTVAFNSNGSIPALTLSGGTLTGSGNVTIAGPSAWSGGTIAGSGALTFDTGATVDMPGSDGMATLNRALVNQGTIRFSGASNGLLIDGVAVTNNGTVDIQSSQNIPATPGTPPFVNAGTLRKSAGASVTEFGPRLSNSGVVLIESGTLQLSERFGQSSGTTTVLSGATLQTTALSLNGGRITGNGTIVGTVTNKAAISPGNSPGILTIDGDYVQDSGGVLNIQIGGTAPGTLYDRVAVTGSVTLDGTLNVTTINGFVRAVGNAFKIITFGSRVNNSTFSTMNGLTGSGTALVPTFGADHLQLITQQIQADLAASVMAPATVDRGSTFAYTVNVFNNGGSDANSVGFTAALPPNVTFTSAVPAVCSGAPNLVCAVGHLNHQATAVVTINVTADSTGPAPINVLASANEPDPNTANNSASASPTITGGADLRITVTGTESTIADTAAIYTIVVLNKGPEAATDILVSAAASEAMTFTANSGACAGSFPCIISALGSGESATINSAWHLSPTATGSVQLSVHAAAPISDPSPSNNSTTATTLIGTCPEILITAPIEMPSGASAEASATYFGPGTYQWSITNGTIDSGGDSSGITFTAGAAGPAMLAVSVTGGGCTLGATFPITVTEKSCDGTGPATLVAPLEDTVTADAVVVFSWNAFEGSSGYRLWLLPQGQAPAQNLGTTLDTSLTKIISPTPPGEAAHQWYVETLFDGCASQESEHRALTVLPAQDCHHRMAPQLSAPAHDESATSATVDFSWQPVENAVEYELWLAPAGGEPTLIRTTSASSYIASVPRGRLEWYVRAIFAGCAATESVHRTFIYTTPPDCASQRPLLIEPAERERVHSPVSFAWREVPGATSYELYVDGVLAATTTSPQASGISVPRDERRWRVRARFAEGCAALDSAEGRFAVLAPPRSCTPLEAPVITAPAQISSGIAGRIRWTFTAGATAYVVEISSDSDFRSGSTSSSTVSARQLPFKFTNEGNAPATRYVRVFAIDGNCVPRGQGPFSPVAEISILPSTSSDGVTLLTDPAGIPYTLNVGPELAGLNFTASPTVPWITVTPSAGTVPPGGQTLQAIAHTADLPPGTSTGSVVITATETATGKPAALGTSPLKLPISVNNIPGITTAPKNTPPPDSLIIPAVAHVKNFIVRYQSDVAVTNTSAQMMQYQINFVPTGQTGLTRGQTTNVAIEPGATLALNSIVNTWFGGRTSSGTLEIRPVTETAASTSSAPVGGLSQRVTFASSRTFTVTPSGGTYGQFVPAVPYANFVSQGDVLFLQQITESEHYRTNLGLVEGSGEPVTLLIRAYDAAGTKRGEFPIELNGGEHTQLDGILEAHGISLADGRIEVEVTQGAGKITAYASIVDNDNSDPLLVPPVTIGQAGQNKWVVPGVAGFTGGSGNWQTDLHIFNAGSESAELTLTFHSLSGTAATRTITLAAGEVRQFDHVLATLFEIAQDGGALHVSSAMPVRVVVTARTYNETGQGAYGQFIPAVTPAETAAAGSRPLQILQAEESPQYRSNVGFAEVSGKDVTLEVSVFRPNESTPALLEVKLGPNEFRQLDSLISSIGLGDTYNARISVRVVEGEGRVAAYLSLIDRITGDPTYVPGQ